MDDQARIIEALSASRIFRDYQQAFHAATGVQVMIVHPSAGLDLSNKMSIGSNIEIELVSRQNYRATIPIRDGTHTIALLQTGLISNNLLEERIPQPPYVESSSASLPFFPISRFRPFLSLIAIFSEHLGTLSNQLVLHQKHCEPAIVLKARKYVQSRFREQIELQEVARHASVSTFYLCKLFKKSTGINFSNYLTRVRVEAAKEMLI